MAEPQHLQDACFGSDFDTMFLEIITRPYTNFRHFKSKHVCSRSSVVSGNLDHYRLHRLGEGEQQAKTQNDINIIYGLTLCF